MSRFAVNKTVLEDAAEVIETRRDMIGESRARIREVSFQQSSGLAAAQAREAVREFSSVADSAQQLLSCIASYLRNAVEMAVETDKSLAGLISEEAF